MQERRQKHTDLLIKEKLKKDDLKNIIKTKAVQYRDFAKNFIDQTKTKNIPTIIMSASGI